MGVSSVIAILVILVLVVFAALSITTSKADLVLSQKTADGVQAFYAADCTAEEMYAQVADAAKYSGEGWQAALDEDYTLSAGEDGGTLVTYSVDIDENRALDVALWVSDGPDFAVERRLWQVVPTGDWEPDESLELFQP
jgi:hypothetical protein